MKIKKAKGNNWFYYKILSGGETGSCHGLWNNENKWIGYGYQNNKKGFWLDCYKR